MDDAVRRLFQGVTNIIRFNWHYYALTLVLLIALQILAFWLLPNYFLFIQAACLFILLPVLISLAVSFYVYDLSGFYKFHWLNLLNDIPKNRLVNIHAGFDETSALLHKAFPSATWKVFDFYDASIHTEASIARARKAYPAFAGTQPVTTRQIPLEDGWADAIFVIMSAHEIRNGYERMLFFKELKRIIRQNGRIIVIEHLRDLPNFIAYTIGFLHFYAKETWMHCFEDAGLVILKEKKLTHFVSLFILAKDGTAN